MFPHYLGSKHQMLSYNLFKKAICIKHQKIYLTHTFPMLFVFLKVRITKLVKDLL